jgi:Tol biopolymer transport system component
MAKRVSLRILGREALIRLAAVWLAALFGSLSAGVASAYNNPSLKWKTIKTEHFEVHYHEGAEWTAQQVALVAEEVHHPLCDLYQYEPDLPVHFIIRDTDDYANGAAFFFENKVEIWATNLEFGYRGTTQWIRNVVTHEYTHIISIQAAMKMGRRVPAIYFQLISFEDEKRPDVLQGYPKDIVTYPISGLVFPPWFAEGVSQFEGPGTTHDCWDTHRDMILRCAVLEDKMLPYDAMGFFGKSSMQGEQVYDHGFGLVNYIASQYGPESIRAITKELRSPVRLSMDGALKKVTGKNGKELYNDWKAHLRERYEDQTAGVDDHRFDGVEVVEAGAKDGYMNVWPVFSPDGKRVAYLSNQGSDYAGTDLYVMDRNGEHRRMVKDGVSSRPAFSPDGQKIFYSRKHQVNRYGSTVNDLFVYHLADKKEKQLTKGARISDPGLSPDGRTIVGVKNGDGTHRIVVLDADGRNEKVLYSAAEGTQFYNPTYSPDGARILFGVFNRGTRDVAVMSADGTGLEYLIATPNDERDASWTADGRGVVFSSDRTGIFNVYELDIETGSFAKRSNVIGGAFNPERSQDGALVYSGYSGDGHGIWLVPADSAPVESMDLATYRTRDVKPYDECTRVAEEPSYPVLSGRPADGSDPGDLATGRDSASVSLPDASNYKAEYTSFQLYPRLTIWDGTARFGLNLASNEILDKQALFGGGSVGTNGEFDLYLAYEIRNFYPTIFADVLKIRELYSEKGTFEQDGSTFLYDYDLQYDLWQADIGLRLELSELYSLDHQHQISAYWSHGEYSVHIEGDEYRDGEYYASPKGGWKYFVGNELFVDWNFRTVSRAVDSDINPRGGRDIRAQYMRSYDKLFTSGQFEYGFKPIYENNDFNRYSLDWREFIALPYLRHSLDLRLYGSVIDRTVDDFFWTYVGGRDGIRGYTYYSLGGKKAALGSIMYRFPILRHIDRQMLSLYFRDLYGGVFYEAANAWSSSGYTSEGYKNAAGFELRLSLGSFYLYPTAISWVSAYAIDPVENVLPGTLPVVIRQERGWSHYLTVGFMFGM